MTYDADVIVIGAGAGGPVVAKELGEQGIKVLMLEAGPWYGNKKWPQANQNPGAGSSSDLGDLDVDLLREYFDKTEQTMLNQVSGRFRWGPADRERSPWFRSLHSGGFIWQSSGIGGTTLNYFGNSPRAFSAAVDNVWPIAYKELVPFYEKVEATLPIKLAPISTKEELFYYGAKKAGWSLLNTLNPTSPGYRPQPNAIFHPTPEIKDSDSPLDDESECCTMRGFCFSGCHQGPSIDKIAKRSTLVSYVPTALSTGNVTVRPNTFVTRILTENDLEDGVRAAGVKFRDTWSGETSHIRAKAVVMAAGCVESPRLWLNSGLPQNPWVGKGLTTHWFDFVTGIFDEKSPETILGSSDVNPHLGQTSMARFDYPGLGSLQASGLSPGLSAAMLYSTSSVGYDCLRPPGQNGTWDIHGRVVGEELKELMADYRRTLSILIMTDDEVNQQNGVSLDPVLKDEHGSVPYISYTPSLRDKQKRDELAKIAAEILRQAGARTIIRTDLPPGVMLHLESTMRMGYVTDTNCEALQVKRLFVADNSVHYNSIGGPNPTLTTQALATRTAEKMAQKYFH